MTSPTKAVSSSPPSAIDRLVSNARCAIDAFPNDNQDVVDMTVRAIAWAVFKPDHAALLARMAVADTGLGCVESKILKNRRKTFGTLRDLLRARTVGIIDEKPDRGLVVYGKPVGVVAALCPSTNPSATPVNKAMMAVKGGNAIIIAPSPTGYRTSAKTVELMRLELSRCGMPEDLVQALPSPVTRQATRNLIEAADLAVVTGSQNNVQTAMRSGTVSIGVGPGNVPAVIDSSADLAAAAKMIRESKTFDYATSCSSENSLIVLDDIYEPAMNALVVEGGWRCSPEDGNRIRETLWQDGKLNRKLIARSPVVMARECGLPEDAARSSFFMVEQDEIDGANGFADEKLSLVLTVYRAATFRKAVLLVRDILEVKGKGHSVGIHTRDINHAHMLAERVDAVRVLVNQAHTFGNGGSFNNCLPFTLSLGGGTWAGNTIDENLNYRHFINVTNLVSAIPVDKPSERELFGPYWKQVQN
ncbi:MAG: aldehyde dehydrogenase family protein [Rhodobacteraceae bacterium]|nr:aldehyde dehydrogenase family protein [Paracoccaceae bacterium]